MFDIDRSTQEDCINTLYVFGNHRSLKNRYLSLTLVLILRTINIIFNN
jgi:hypothetical protein